MQKKKQIPSEVYDNLDGMVMGENRRVHHVGCSEGKDPCLSITRIRKGYWYECFRCSPDCRGLVTLDKRPLADTKSWLAKRKDTNNFAAQDSLYLPTDTCNLNSNLHSDAMMWLWDMEFTDEWISKYEFGWSNLYGRIIMPVYDTGLIKYNSSKKLIGWVGRHLGDVTKHRPKTLTKKQAGLGRIYYTLKGESKIVVVEDIPSAIKVYEATGYSTLALLGSGIDMELLTLLPREEIVLWVDEDMRFKKALPFIKRSRGLGWHLSRITTRKDPKNQPMDTIRSMI